MKMTDIQAIDFAIAIKELKKKSVERVAHANKLLSEANGIDFAVVELEREFKRQLELLEKTK